MDKIPGLNPENLKFRQRASSAVLNKHSQEALYDVLNIVNRQNKIDEDIKHTASIVTIDSVYNKMELDRLESEAIQLRQQVQDLLDPNGFRTMTVTPNQMHIEGKESTAAIIDKVNNCVTLPYASSESKLVLVDDIKGRTYIPKGLVIKSNIVDTTGVENIEETDIYNSVNGDDNKYWMMKIKTKPETSKVKMEVVIDLPDEIISSRDINTIIVNPFPFKGMDMINVEYKLFGDWMPVPSFNEHKESEIYFYNEVEASKIPHCGNIMLSFKPIMAKQIRLTFEQSDYVESDGSRIFHMGARHIGVYNRHYYVQAGEFYVKLKFNGDKIKTIYDIGAILNNQQQVGLNVMQYEFFSLDDFDVPSRIAKSFPFTINNNKLLVKCSIYNSSTSPNLAQVNLIYKD